MLLEISASLRKLSLNEFFPDKVAVRRSANSNEFLQRNFSVIKIKLFYLTLCKKGTLEYFLIVALEHYRLVKSKRHRTVFYNNNFSMKFKVKQYIKAASFLLKLSSFYKHGESANCIQSCIETNEIVSALRQKFYIRN